MESFWAMLKRGYLKSYVGLEEMYAHGIINHAVKTCMDREQLLVVSNSSVTESTQAP